MRVCYFYCLDLLNNNVNIETGELSVKAKIKDVSSASCRCCDASRCPKTSAWFVVFLTFEHEKQAMFQSVMSLCGEFTVSLNFIHSYCCSSRFSSLFHAGVVVVGGDAAFTCTHSSENYGMKGFFRRHIEMYVFKAGVAQPGPEPP